MRLVSDSSLYSFTKPSNCLYILKNIYINEWMINSIQPKSSLCSIRCVFIHKYKRGYIIYLKHM